jgi:pilus assembly protein Flp/PilA
MFSQLRNLWSDESGQAMVEYGVIIAVVAVAAIAIVTMLWEQIDGMFGDITTNLQDAPGNVNPNGSVD